MFSYDFNLLAVSVSVAVSKVGGILINLLFIYLPTSNKCLLGVLKCLQKIRIPNISYHFKFLSTLAPYSAFINDINK